MKRIARFALYAGIFISIVLSTIFLIAAIVGGIALDQILVFRVYLQNYQATIGNGLAGFANLDVLIANSTISIACMFFAAILAQFVRFTRPSPKTTPTRAA